MTFSTTAAAAVKMLTIGRKYAGTKNLSFTSCIPLSSQGPIERPTLAKPANAATTTINTWPGTPCVRLVEVRCHASIPNATTPTLMSVVLMGKSHK
jgi:hypothetical protein